MILFVFVVIANREVLFSNNQNTSQQIIIVNVDAQINTAEKEIDELLDLLSVEGSGFEKIEKELLVI